MNRAITFILTIAIAFALLVVALLRGHGTGVLESWLEDQKEGRGAVATVSADTAELDMVRIPGGTFFLGSDDGKERERPVTRVTLSPYDIDRTEVTVAAYRKCVRAGKCQPQATEDWSGLADTDDWPDLEDVSIEERSAFCNFDKPGRDNHPMNCVDWNQASNFCAWRGARLPTEAEWEFAAKGTDGRKYPWGNQRPGPELARWNSGDGTVPVGSYPAGASPFGLMDMAGNVGEWVADWFGPYPGGNVSNPRRENGDTYRVARGGSWYNDEADVLRTSYRGWSAPAVRYNRLGFRCARRDDSGSD